MISRRKLVRSGVTLAYISLLPSSLFGQTPPNISFDPTKPWPLSAGDLDRIRKRLASFFERVVALSLASPPPGTNASNGWFFKALREDAELTVAQRPIQTESQGGFGCAQQVQSLMQAMRTGASRGNHFATGLTYAPLAGKALEAILPSIAQIAVTAIVTYYSGGATGAVLEKEVEDLVNNMGETVAKANNVTSGDHPNGYISSDMRDQANQIIKDLDFSKGAYDPDGKDLCEILKALMKSVTFLSTDGHDPWLRAEWQIGFTGISAATAKMMRHPPD